jgi:predicted secreted protein
VLLCVLPFGIVSQTESGTITTGTDYGAPIKSNIKKKLIIATGVTFIFWLVIFIIMQNNMIELSQFSVFDGR